MQLTCYFTCRLERSQLSACLDQHVWDFGSREEGMPIVLSVNIPFGHFADACDGPRSSVIGDGSFSPLDNIWSIKRYTRPMSNDIKCSRCAEEIDCAYGLWIVVFTLGCSEREGVNESAHGTLTQNRKRKWKHHTIYYGRWLCIGWSVLTVNFDEDRYDRGRESYIYIPTHTCIHS